MKRGDIYWVDLEPTKGSEINKMRPCVIVSATAINKARNTVVMVPLSSVAKVRPPLVISVHCLNKNVGAVCDQIRTIDKSRLGKPAGQLSLQEMNALDDGLKRVLSL